MKSVISNHHHHHHHHRPIVSHSALYEPYSWQNKGTSKTRQSVLRWILNYFCQVNREVYCFIVILLYVGLLTS